MICEIVNECGIQDNNHIENNHKEEKFWSLEQNKELIINKKNILAAKQVIKKYNGNAIVITPYNSQRNEYLKQDINCYTIDGAQGREWKNVNLDLVRCNSNKTIGFVDELYRCIVALSRHEETLTILGCNKVISKSIFRDLPFRTEIHQEEYTEKVGRLVNCKNT